MDVQQGFASGTPVIAFYTGLLVTRPDTGTPAVVQVDGYPSVFRSVEQFENVIPVVTVGPAAPAGLTEHELRVLHLVAAGQSDREIGRTLGVSRETVKTHVRKARIKIGARNRVEFVVMAHQRGIVRLTTLGAVVEHGSVAAPAKLPELTHREERLFDLIAEGLSNREIAARLCYSPRSVPRLVTTLLRRVGLTRDQAVEFGAQDSREAVSA
jgi:DNA-binding CsgD family transcriptional regulator